ncbi:MAG: recombination protein RecR [Parcubacteria group bacterium]|nr:recombination protein RecR [Parcubacteria group bacterium]
MTSAIPSNVESLVAELQKLPGIGRKSAERMTLALLARPKEEVAALSAALTKLQSTIRYCRECFGLTEAVLCAICRDPGRDHALLCVVEDPLDLIAIEKTGAYRGVYHVLGGVLSPIDGVGPHDLKLKELLSRVRNQKNHFRELILATNPTPEGETTVTFIREELKGATLTMTRLAYGLPAGADIEYADERTLTQSLEGRRVVREAKTKLPSRS